MADQPLPALPPPHLIFPEEAFDMRWIKMKDGRLITLLDFFCEMARKETVHLIQAAMNIKTVEKVRKRHG